MTTPRTTPRRFTLAILLAIAACTVHAQVWLGGEVALHTNSISMNGYQTQSGKYVAFAPEVGYAFNPRWAVALKVGYAYLKHQEITVLGQSLPGSGNQLRVAPFVRGTFAHAGRFHFFADAGPSYTLLQRYGEESLHTLGVQAAVGLRFDISGRVALTGRFGIAGYDHSWMTVRTTTLRSNDFHLDLTDDISLGITVNLNRQTHEPQQ